MSANKAILGLISLIFFAVFFSSIGFSGTLGTFDAGNSCFCKGDLGVAGGLLCNLEKTAFYFFDTKVACGKETSSSEIVGSSFSSGSGGPASEGASGSSGGKETTIGTKDKDATCSSSDECKDSLICAIENKDTNAYIDVKLKTTKLAKGQKAVCTGLPAERIDKACNYDKECPFSILYNKIAYCSKTGKKCVSEDILKLSCGNQSASGAEGCNTILTDGSSYSFLDYICNPNTALCSLPGFANLGDTCNNSEECSSGVCQANKCVACNSDSQCKNDQFCSLGACEGKLAITETCTRNEECKSNVCDSTSKTCKGGLYEQGCTDNADCSGELICDASLGVCKKNEDKTLCTKGSCESGYFCSKNGVFVNKGYGSVCLQSFAKSKGSTCYKDMECKTGLRCILNNKKIANQYEDNTNYLYTLGKEWSHKISDPTAGVCENLTETGFCEDTSDCSSGLTCTNGVCSVASTTAEKLSLLTPCNYSIDCKSGFCTKIGNKQVCTISDDLFLSGNQITSSYGLVSNAPFTGSVEEEWGTGKKYYPDCRKSQIILNKEYKESSFCKIAFGEKYSKCQSYDGVCAEFENEKYLAGLDSEAYKITVRVLFEMSCVGGMSGYEDDAVYKHVLSFGCNEGDIKPQCETVFSHPTRKFCGASGSNLVTFDLAGITFNPITDYAISYTSEGGKEFDMDDEPGKDYDSDNYSINLPKITNGTATCMITRVTQTYKNVEDELISSIYVECYNGEE